MNSSHSTATVKEIELREKTLGATYNLAEVGSQDGGNGRRRCCVGRTKHVRNPKRNNCRSVRLRY